MYHSDVFSWKLKLEKETCMHLVQKRHFVSSDCKKEQLGSFFQEDGLFVNTCHHEGFLFLHLLLSSAEQMRQAEYYLIGTDYEVGLSSSNFWLRHQSR